VGAVTPSRGGGGGGPVCGEGDAGQRPGDQGAGGPGGGGGRGPNTGARGGRARSRRTRMWPAAPRGHRGLRGPRGSSLRREGGTLGPSTGYRGSLGLWGTDKEPGRRQKPNQRNLGDLAFDSVGETPLAEGHATHPDDRGHGRWARWPMVRPSENRKPTLPSGKNQWGCHRVNCPPAHKTRAENKSPQKLSVSRMCLNLSRRILNRWRNTIHFCQFMHGQKLKYKPEGKNAPPKKNWREKMRTVESVPSCGSCPRRRPPPPPPLRSPHIPSRRWQSSAIAPGTGCISLRGVGRGSVAVPP